MVALLLLAVFANTPTPQQLVNAYIDSTRTLDDAEFHIQIKDTHHGQTRMNGMAVREGIYDVVHSGVKWKLSYSGVVRFKDAKGMVKSALERYEILRTDKYIQVLGSGKELSVGASFDGLPLGNAIGTLDVFSALFGFLPGNSVGREVIQLADVLKASKLSVQPHDGRRGWRLEGVGEYGHVTIWFSADMDVERVQVVKADRDLLDGSRIVDRPIGTADAWYPGGKALGFDVMLDIKQRGDWDGKDFPVRATLTQVRTFTLGKVTSEYDMQVDNVVIGQVPDDAFKISADIKDGTYVQVDDRPNVEYEWRGGEIVKAVNQRTVERLRGSSYFSTFSITGYFLLFAILLLVALGLISWMRQRIA